ncbi:MAG TPA: polysaccharide pyruvyl transferase family protein [Anaerolineae bacterium]|nr:polysaccharide pyruvyl transferase family protein [Anaerolineae bacterium]
MNDLVTPLAIQEVLRQRLAPEIGAYKTCALLEFARWNNAGIHALWLGSVSYLLDTARVKVAYISNHRNFSPEQLARRAGKAPIIFRAGVLNDGWSGTIELVDFCNRLITTYRDRPIIFLPRSISFNSQAKFQELVKTFNAHPRLTVLVRDEASYALAMEHLNCRVSLMPDIAFQLADKLQSVSFNTPTDKILFLRRSDWPADPAFDPKNFGLSNLVVQDWSTTQALRLPWRGRGLNRLWRAVWLTRLAVPAEWRSRRRWLKAATSPSQRDARFHFSWQMLHQSLYQLQQYRLVITNRLHGHILCVLLGIPNIVLPGPHRNTDVIFQSWTAQIPYCRFATTAADIKRLAQELLDKFPTPSRPVRLPLNSQSR